MSVLLAIDPGTTRSAWLRYSVGDRRVLGFGIQDNAELLRACRDAALPPKWLGPAPVYPSPNAAVIEKVESFGMAVGAEIFETVFWSGRFAEALHPVPVGRIGRIAVKTHLCHSANAKDANVRQALIDRFGGPDAIGTKRAPGPLYGIANDVWSALAVAVTWAETGGKP